MTSLNLKLSTRPQDYLGLNSDTADIERLTKLIQHFPILKQALLLGVVVVSLFVNPLDAIAESIVAEGSASYRILKREYADTMGTDKLLGTVGGQDYWITNIGDAAPVSSMEAHSYVKLLEVEDLDNDGYNDALISIQAGGNGSAPIYYVAAHMGGGMFSVTTAKHLYSYGGYELLPQLDGTSMLKVFQSEAGVGLHDRTDGIAIYRLNFGQLQLVSHVTNHAQIPTLLKIRSVDLAKVGKATYDFDLDSDGQDDEIICNYWERWGAMRCGFSMTRHGYVEYPIGVHHLGIAETSTAGVFDIVTDWVNLSKYDGETFVPQ
jgi:hypothetical protein